MAGGCFWCLDAIYRRVRGVERVESGYTGGSWPDPDYRAVCTGASGHAEAVRVLYHPDVVPVEVLLEIFFTSHDPTTLNRQGYDVGTQYRSALFTHHDAETQTFQRAIEQAQRNWEDPIVTTIEPVATWYPAEKEHQDFYAQQPHVGYCQVIINPKLARVRQHYSMWLTD